MEIFKTHKPCLILFFLIFHCSSLHPGDAMYLSERTEGITTQQQVAAGPKQDGKILPLASPPFPIPASYKNSPFGPSLNIPEQQPQSVFPPQQLNYPQQSPKQPLSGFAQPFSSINQPFLGVNQQPFSSFKPPFSVGNQQGSADESNTLDKGVSENNRLIIAVALAPLLAVMANLNFIF